MKTSFAGAIICLLVLLPSLFFSYRIRGILAGSEARHVTLSKFPKELGPWHGTDTSRLDARSKEILKLDEYLRREYRTDDGRSVFVYVGYWKRQSGEHQAAKHSPLMCFPANGLTISRPEERRLPSTRLNAGGDQRFAVSRLLATDKRQRTSLYYYWFFSGKETYRDESLALLYVLRETIFQGRSDGGIVEISADVPEASATADRQQQAEESLRDFASVFVPALEALVDDAKPAN